MRRMIDNDYLTLIVRLVIGFTFIYASLYKIIDPNDFARSIWFYHLVPGSLINLMALILPWVEFSCGVFLVIGVLYDGSVVMVNLLTFIFILALSSTIFRGLDIDCGCFKASHVATDSAWDSLLLDFGLIVLTLQLLFSRSRKWRLQSK